MKGIAQKTLNRDRVDDKKAYIEKSVSSGLIIRGERNETVAIDSDGTLLSPEVAITVENVEALRKAQSRGNIVMICSGRAPEDIQQILKKYDISCPLAGSNGTVVQANGKLLENISMSREDIIKIAEKLDQDRVPYRIYTNRGIYVPADWSEPSDVCREKR